MRMDMESDSDSDLDDGPVFTVHRDNRGAQSEDTARQFYNNRPSESDMERYRYIQGGLRSILEDGGQLRWLRNMPPVLDISFGANSQYFWSLNIMLDFSQEWACVQTAFTPKDDVRFTETFTQKDLCLGYIIQMCDIRSKVSRLREKMLALHDKFRMPWFNLKLIKGGGHFPFTKMQMSDKYRRGQKISVHFINEHERWPDKTWARVDISTEENTTTVYCENEKDTFNHIISHMDTGLHIDYYSQIT
jgi:hypothetical protein